MLGLSFKICVIAFCIMQLAITNIFPDAFTQSLIRISPEQAMILLKVLFFFKVIFFLVK